MKIFVVVIAIFSLTILPPIFSYDENKVLREDISVEIVNINSGMGYVTK